jgi:hypothetical protein
MGGLDRIGEDGELVKEATIRAETGDALSPGMASGGVHLECWPCEPAEPTH